MTMSLTARPVDVPGLPVGPEPAVPLEDLPLAVRGHRVMHLLERGVPLTLLIDLLTPYGSAATEILATEAAGGA